MTIEEIYHSEHISVRSLNICKDNTIADLAALLKYYRENKTFDNLRNCGRKSNEELTSICLKYINNEDREFVEHTKKENKLIYLISDLSRTQREIINSFIEINLNNLTNRSKNAITSYLKGNIKFRNISEKILFNDRFNLQEIKNVGAKTVTELNHFIKSIIEFLEKILNVENENDLIVLRNRFFIEKSFSISTIPSEILEARSIFKLVDFLILENAIFEKKQNNIFQKAFKIYDNQEELNLNEIAEEFNISSERVRQLRKSSYEDLFNNFKFIKHIDDDLHQKYDIDQNEHLINIDADLNNKINEVNKTNFSIEFNTFIIYSYISDKFDLIGKIEDVLLPKFFNSRDRHNWDNFYLVKKNISYLLNFQDFVDDLEVRSSERIAESYNFNFKSYLMSFSTSTNLDALNVISEVAENILNNEFGIYLDIDDNISFNRNSLKQVYEYAYEAMKSIGNPAKVNEITRKIKELHPDYETDDAKVRASMKRQNGFVPLGRSSIFGLQEWENELENFKGGTIRNIAYAYLENEDEPKHISNIAEYVLKYRPNTYERSILDNLKADDTKTFVFFKNSTIGLSSKKYDNSILELFQIKSIETKTWEERYKDFTQFINTNNRLPFSSAYLDEEIKLYRWYKVQEEKIKNGNLENKKSNLLTQIIVQFDRKIHKT